MIEVTNKLDVDKIKKRMRWSQFKQICKSAKEQEEAKNNSVNNINKEIEIKENGIEPDPKNQTRINGTQSPVTTDNNIIINNINNNIIINNINNNIIINNINNNVIIDNNQSNPYTLLAVLGIFLPIIPAIIFGIKIYNKKHKLTVGDVVLIIVGLIPVISAIVFGINAYKYNQNNIDEKIPKNLKYVDNMDKNNINYKSDINNEGKIHPISSMVNDSQHQNQDQENKE